MVAITTTTRDGYRYSYRNRQEFEHIYRDIHHGIGFNLNLSNTAPEIIDAGAHIGVATLFFKRHFPDAHIVAFEPNPDTCAILEHNIRQNRLGNIEIVNAALAMQVGYATLYISDDQVTPWSWGDSIVNTTWHAGGGTTSIMIPTTTLSSYLTRPVDLLKLDVEGAETDILGEAGARIELIEHINMEFHGSAANTDNDYAALMALLRTHGFEPRTFQGDMLVHDVPRDDPYWLDVRASRIARRRD